MNSISIRKHKGFTLVEVLTVMVVLVALASITIEMSAELAFQGRYEITKDRFEKIRRAIIGRPDVLVNGNPDISGFVADMGRPPDVLRELLQPFSCSDNTKKRPRDCVSPATMDWTGGISYVEDGTTKLKHGWNGPYLSSSAPADDTGTLSDGWGNKSPSNNTGWDEAAWLNASPYNNYGWVVSAITNVGDEFKAKSIGKDQNINAVGCLNYDDDCEYTLAGNKYSITNPSVMVLINTNDESTYTDTGNCGLCSDPAKIRKQVCEDGGETWTDEPTYTNKQTCIDNGKNWTALISSTPPYPAQGVCMKIFYRNANSITSLSSFNGSNPAVEKDGTQQAANFEFSGTIPNGINAIGIYKYDGTSCSEDIYPAEHPIKHVVFAPYKSLNGLVW